MKFAIIRNVVLHGERRVLYWDGIFFNPFEDMKMVFNTHKEAKQEVSFLAHARAEILPLGTEQEIESFNHWQKLGGNSLGPPQLIEYPGKMWSFEKIYTH